MKDMTWIKGQPSPYELHDLTHFPDWRGLIVWDAFFNNLTAGLMVIIAITGLATARVFGVLLPYALILAFIILAVDLFLLVADLGDPWRFLHSLRVFRPTSPLSVGVWALTGYAICLFLAILTTWLPALLGVPHAVGMHMVMASRMFTTLAALCAAVVICYKGVVFSCTSQPGVKNARWLTSFMVSDSLLMGCGLYMCFAVFLGAGMANAWLMVPFHILLVIRFGTFWLLWLDVAPRARRVHRSNAGIFIMVYIVGGVIAAALACKGGQPGILAAGALVLITGVCERAWVIGLARPL